MDAVTEWVFAVVDRLGAAGIGLLIFLENVVPPIPSEVILPLGGFRAQVGVMNPIAVWAAATIGAVAGALVLYALGAWLGYERVHRLAGHRWFLLSSQKDLDRGRALFDRHGGPIVLFGRCVPLVRSLVSIPAGISGMPLVRFTALSALGSAVWNALFVGLGWFLGDRWEVIEQYMGPISTAVLVVAVVAIGWLVVRRVRSRNAAADSRA
ncbi:membrane protein DedA with SNARE-associated domain [Pseudonocardia sediminis]|uniref:Membrane protein DedA with SNARE-associated domain n=1 Tax=Pseudonocardia sediminis TaxID=1397368 RepID=A0A4Q7UQA6_PSEST|nr:membrane protein DedA with SNARE-associated domain [Pseudonocardia sediminis]